MVSTEGMTITLICPRVRAGMLPRSISMIEVFPDSRGPVMTSLMSSGGSIDSVRGVYTSDAIP
eukprot:3770878-Rhodomonas_salina.2